MAVYRVTSGVTTLHVDGDNWMTALGTSLQALGFTAQELGLLHIRTESGGVVSVSPPDSHRAFTLSPVTVALGPQHARIAPAAAEGPPIDIADAPDAPLFKPKVKRPTLMMPASSLAQHLAGRGGPPPVSVKPRPQDLGEQIFIQCTRIAQTTDIDAAAREALAVLGELVPADAGAVLLVTADGAEMRFAAATGPASTRVAGLTMNSNTGVAGLVHRLGAGLILNHADMDSRHDDSVDQAVGFETQAILAAALKDSNGVSHGCLELLNPPGDFQQWHLEAAQGVAGSLAEFIAARR